MKFKMLISVFALLANCNLGVNSQSLNFNAKFLLEDRGTTIRNIILNGNQLLLSGEIGRDSFGLSGYYLLRIDSFGNFIKLNVFRDPNLSDHQLLDGRDPVIIDEDGNIVLAGIFLTRDDLYVMQLNHNFDSIWYQEYESDYKTMYAHNTIEIDGYYYITGFVQTSNFDLDVIIQKISANGEFIWAKTFGLLERDEFARSAISEDGGLTIMITESLDPSPIIKNDTRYWIRFMHIDTSGAIKKDWKEEVTGYEGWAGTLLKYRNDYIYTTNVIGDETNFGPLTAGQVVRRDSAFNIVWKKPLGEPDSQFSGLGDMIFSKDSCLLVTGQNVDSSGGFNAARIMKLNLDGELLWEVRDTGISLPNGQSLNIMEGITQSESGSIYAVGYTYRSANFYEGLLLKISGDGCIDTICSTTAINEYLLPEKEGMILCPNPVSNHVSVKFKRDLPAGAAISVCNMLGVEILRQQMTGDGEHIDVSTWDNGLYLITLKVNGQMVTSEKILKVNLN